MGYCQHYRSPVDDGVYLFCAETLAEAEYEAGLVKQITLRHWITVREVWAMIDAALKEDGGGVSLADRLTELRRRRAEM